MDRPSQPQTLPHISCSSNRLNTSSHRFHPYLLERPPSSNYDDGRRVLLSNVDMYYYYWHCRNINRMSREQIQMSYLNQHPYCMMQPRSNTETRIPRTTTTIHSSTTSIMTSPFTWGQNNPHLSVVPLYPSQGYTSSSHATCPPRIHRSHMVQESHGRLLIPGNDTNAVKPFDLQESFVQNGNLNAENKEKEDSTKKDVDETLCTICLDSKKSILFLPCCHMCCCKKCGFHPSLARRCPLCRSLIQGYKVVYW